MRIADFVITAAMVGGLSAPALAQTPSGQTQTAPTPAPNPVASTGTPAYDPYGDHWIASGFAGTNFHSGRTDTLNGIDIDESGTSFSFGGQVAYLWGGIAGVEGLAEFTPSFALNDVLFENKPDINTYMANGIAALHLGGEHRYMPYVSGGVGAIQMRSTIFVLDPVTLSEIGTVSDTGSRFGGDIGGGLMGFAGNWGFRGDLRYYKTSVDNNIDFTDVGTGNAFTQGVLSGLAFWKANVGVAFRW